MTPNDAPELPPEWLPGSPTMSTTWPLKQSGGLYVLGEMKGADLEKVPTGAALLQY
ncbi:MAG: hypothetical protein QM756_45135 [Polyangiaceae bacterium]